MPVSARFPRRALAALYACAALAAWWIGPDGPVYWDSFGYVIQAIEGRAGGLMLGRPTFIVASHAFVTVWRSLGGGVWSVEAMLRAVWTLVSAAGAPALACVAWRAGMSTRASCLAGMFLALSPAVAHTSRAVLTDAPSMAVTLVAFAIALGAVARGSLVRMALAGVVLGLAAGLREQASLHIVTLAAIAWTSPRRRLGLALSPLAGCAMAIGVPVAHFAMYQRGYFASVIDWSLSMARERAMYSHGASDLAMFVVWMFASGPVALAFAAMGFWRWRKWNPSLRALIVPSAIQLMALAFYQDISFSPRYLLAALPCAVMLPAASALDSEWDRALSRHAALALVLTMAIVAGPVIRLAESPLREGIRTLPARLATLPRNAAVVTGRLCPAVVYQRELTGLDEQAQGPPPAWVQVCPGWRWPSDLARRLDALRAEGHPIVIDLRCDSWVGTRQEVNRDEAARYAQAHASDVTVWH